MKKLSLGILAHVDAGKTTLTESLLFDTGMIRSAGRVDNGDAFLDTETLEKKRGVTILSKQAICKLNKDDELNDSGDDIKITIIDTPGHTDFIGEAERVLGILDIAVLLVSGPDGVTASTKRLAGMLKSYKVPYFVFVNKMDMCQRSEDEIKTELSDILGEGFLKCEGASKEDIASLSENTIEKYLEEGSISDEDIENLIFSRRFHPVIFGSALKNTGVDFLIKTITRYIPDGEYRKDFSAKIFKVGYEDGHKLAFAKITGGSVSVRNEIDDERLAGEKITQIRCYSGGKYENTDMAEAGDVVTFVGLESAYAGMGLGGEFDEEQPLCQPVLRYDLELPIDVPLRVFLPKLKELAMEDPLLGLEVSDDDRVSVSVMGEFQMEILKETIKERFDVSVNFVKGSFVYKETIKYPVIGYGHFEPLRHYSEVQILMEPLAQGNGIEVASDLSVNDLDINWQKTIISTLTEHLPVGVLTGAQLTDIRFTLIAGKAHLKHTDSQDFRESVRRAIRQGLMKTESLLLEPVYDFVVNLPAESVGRVMTDISDMGGSCTVSADGSLVGTAPARCISDYQSKLTQFTSGQGTIELKFSGYHDMPEQIMEEIIEDKGYDPDSDKNNPSGSIFISHGAGYYVPWYECEELMHLPSKESDYLDVDEESEEERLLREAENLRLAKERGQSSLEEGLQAIGTDEIDDILRSATHSNAGKENRRTKRVYLSKGTVQAENRSRKNATIRKNAAERRKYLLVDGYNIIHAWADLKSLLEDGSSNADRQSLSLEAARFKLLEMMSEYKAMKDTEIIVVFDAYNVRGHFTEKLDYMGVHVVYTKEAETADQYIARFTVENSKNFDITVATSDGLIQLIIRGEDSKMLSARDLENDYKNIKNQLLDQY